MAKLTFFPGSPRKRPTHKFNASEQLVAWSRDLLAMQARVSRAGDSFEGVMQTVLASALRMMPGADGGVVGIAEGPQLVFRAATGTSWPDKGLRIGTADSLLGYCLCTGQNLVLKDYQSDDRVDSATFCPSGARSAIIVPLPFNGRTIGILAFYSRVPHGFGQQDLLTAQLLAGPIVIGLATTSQAKAQQLLLSENRRFVATFEQAAVGIAHVGPEGHFLLVNDRFCEIAGHPREVLLTDGFQRITHADDLGADLAHVADLIAGRASTYSMEKRYIRSDGEIAWVNLTVSLVREDDGTPEFFVAVIEDITRLKSAQTDAAHDQLTGLLNRRGLLMRAKLSLSGRRSAELPMAIVYIDLDGFKAINDRFGHGEGDRCLQKIAAILKRTLRSQDVLARLGGDEFLALLPNSSETDAADAIGRLQEAVATAGVGEPWEIAASVGAVVIPVGIKVDPAEAVAAADRLMYRAKQSKEVRPVVETYCAT